MLSKFSLPIIIIDFDYILILIDIDFDYIYQNVRSTARAMITVLCMAEKIHDDKFCSYVLHHLFWNQCQQQSILSAGIVIFHSAFIAKTIMWPSGKEKASTPCTLLFSYMEDFMSEPWHPRKIIIIYEDYPNIDYPKLTFPETNPIFHDILSE